MLLVWYPAKGPLARFCPTSRYLVRWNPHVSLLYCPPQDLFIVRFRVIQKIPLWSAGWGANSLVQPGGRHLERGGCFSAWFSGNTARSGPIKICRGREKIKSFIHNRFNISVSRPSIHFAETGSFRATFLYSGGLESAFRPPLQDHSL